MSFVTGHEGEETPAPEVPGTIYHPEYRTSLVDVRDYKPESLLTNISGSPWTVTYYSQYLGQDEDASPFQAFQLPVYQQYLKINEMELRVDGALTESQDPDTMEMTVTGSATVYPFLIPNQGDTFLADVGDGRTGVFSVTSTERLSMFKQSVYQIEYVLINYLSRDVAEELDKRVVKETFFKKDLFINAQYPLLVEADLKILDDLNDMKALLLNRFNLEFFSRELSTYVVPGQSKPTYDPYVTQTMLRLFNAGDNKFMRRVREMNVDGLRVMDMYNFWNLVLSMDDDGLPFAAQKMWVIPTRRFANNPLMHGIRFSRFEQVVYPMLVPDNADSDEGFLGTIAGLEYVNPGDMDYDLISIFQDTDAGSLEYPEGVTPPETDPPTDPLPADPVPIIHPTLIDDYYVLSENFYTDSETDQSLLELVTGRTMRNEGVEFDEIKAIYDDVGSWGRLERYYYIPLLLAIIIVKQRRL